MLRDNAELRIDSFEMSVAAFFRMPRTAGKGEEFYNSVSQLQQSIIFVRIKCVYPHGIAIVELKKDVLGLAGWTKPNNQK